MADSQVRAARIAAVAAIIAAVISAASGASTYFATQNQINAEDERSAIEFLREQRKSTYIDFMADHQIAYAAEFRCLDKVIEITERDNRSPDGTYNDLAGKVAEARDKFAQSNAALQLVASEQVGEIANRIALTHDLLTSACPPNPDMLDEQNLSEIDHGLKDLLSIYSLEFLPEARRDMASR